MRVSVIAEVNYVTNYLFGEFQNSKKKITVIAFTYSIESSLYHFILNLSISLEISNCKLSEKYFRNGNKLCLFDKKYLSKIGGHLMDDCDSRCRSKLRI